MIHLSFSLNNPFVRPVFKLLFVRYFNFKYKTFEAQIYKDSADLIALNINYTIRGDHAGITLGVGLFGYRFDINVYDNRHWDYVTNDWMKHNEN